MAKTEKKESLKLKNRQVPGLPREKTPFQLVNQIEEGLRKENDF